MVKATAKLLSTQHSHGVRVEKKFTKNIQRQPLLKHIIYTITWLSLSDLFNWQTTKIQDTKCKHSQIGSLDCAVLGLLGVQLMHKLSLLWCIPAHLYLLFIFFLICIIKNVTFSGNSYSVQFYGL